MGTSEARGIGCGLGGTYGRAAMPPSSAPGQASAGEPWPGSLLSRGAGGKSLGDGTARAVGAGVAVPCCGGSAIGCSSAVILSSVSAITTSSRTARLSRRARAFRMPPGRSRAGAGSIRVPAARRKPATSSSERRPSLRLSYDAPPSTARTKSRSSSWPRPAASASGSRRVPLPLSRSGWRATKPPSRPCCQP